MAYKAETARRKAKATWKISLARKIEPGQTFGMLTVQKVGTVEPKTGAIRVKTQCECGAILYVLPSALLYGTAKTCGNPDCTSKMKSRTYYEKRTGTGNGCSEFEERKFYVENKLPIGEYTAGCFENLK